MAHQVAPDAHDHQPPGTLLLEDLQHGRDRVFLHPVPTADPNDPLNWPTWRKTVSMCLVLVYVTLTFAQLNIGTVAFGQYQAALGFNIDDLNRGQALGYAGLGCGSVLFIPLMNKYGRRPIYILSLALQVGGCVWAAMTKTTADLLLSNALAGLGGAICETTVQVTISDLFFVHQHASMNAYYMFCTFFGSSLGPVAAGYIIDSQGWRWMWWWCVILMGANFVTVLFFFEESKYMPVIHGEPTSQQHGQDEQDLESDAKVKYTEQTLERSVTHRSVNNRIPVKSYGKRMAFLTTTDEPIFRHMHDPFVVLFTFPAVTFAAITFGIFLALFAVLVSIQSTYLFLPPYNFTATGVGLMSIAAFVSGIPAVFVGGWLDDWLIVWLSKRNGGLYEPEMRLWLALPCAILTPAGVLMAGLGLAYGLAWPLIAVGGALFSFCLGVSGIIALSYTMDCYPDIVGVSMIGITFTRNVFAVVILFVLTPWVKAMGLVNIYIIVVVVVFVMLLLPLSFLKWGKRFRVATALRYQERAQRQPTLRRL